MTDKIIRFEDDSFLLTAVVPDQVNGATEYTVAIYDLEGNEILEATDADVGKADTLKSASVAGSQSITLTYDPLDLERHTPKTGDIIRVGSDSAGRQNLTVRTFNASTGLLNTREFVSFNFPSGTAVEFRNLSFDLDTTAEKWTDIETVTVVWDSDTDIVAWTEIWRVLKRSSAIGGLESKFRTAYPRYWENIPEGAFGEYASRAKMRIKNYFESRGRNLDKIVESGQLEEITLVQIALLVAGAHSDRFSEEIKYLKMDYSDLLGMIDSMRIWVDDNQDLVKDDGENEPAIQYGLSRGL